MPEPAVQGTVVPPPDPLIRAPGGPLTADMVFPLIRKRIDKGRASRR